MIYIILGMHKSGTTLVAKTLHQSGIAMGERFQEEASYLDMKYEAGWAQDINDEILGISRKEFSLNVTSGCLVENRVGDNLVQKMRAGIARFSDEFKDWGFKDPRSALTYQYWKDLLPEHKVVVVYRDPQAVWRRYFKFISWLRIRSPFQVWVDYNRSILDSVSDLRSEDVLYLCFDKLLSGQDEWARLEGFVGKQLVNVCDPAQSVNRFGESGYASLQYNLLKVLAGSRVSDIYTRLIRLRSEQLVGEQAKNS